MPLSPPAPASPPPDAPLDTAKRRQILEGARRVFLERGYDAASMNDVTRAAGVSKGTVYAYFPSKEDLFKALVIVDKQEQVERVCQMGKDELNLRDALIQQGSALLSGLTAPDSMARVRMVIGVAPRLPEIGRAFFESGYGTGVRRMAEFLATRAAAGEITLDDPEYAARALINMCFGDLMRRILFCVIDTPTLEQVRADVVAGVDLFLRAHDYAPAANRRMESN